MRTKMREGNSTVATVMPEIGFEEDPTLPVSRDETVTNRKPKRTIRIAPTGLRKRFNDGESMIMAIRAMMPPKTNCTGKSSSTRALAAVLTAPDDLFQGKSFMPSFMPLQMVGSERSRLI